tara:strand:+ start:41 stop:199 length:159 start_codon:yes stop_codon:yes gene_type:complete
MSLVRSRVNKKSYHKCRFCGCDKVKVQLIADTSGKVRRKIKCSMANCGKIAK